MPELFFATAKDFNDWLSENHESAKELWVCYYKKNTGKPTISWEESVEEALCYGWIDGIRQTRDKESYRIRFTPRRKTSIWSPKNLATIKKLIREDRLKPPGKAIYEQRKKDHAVPYENMKKDFSLPVDYLRELKEDTQTWAYYSKLPPGYLKQIIRWIMTAKMEETRRRRFTRFLKSCKNEERLT